MISVNRNFIFGIPDIYSLSFDFDNVFNKQAESTVKILLSHNPDVIDFVEDHDNIDLILSGHNHSGQIYFKFIGPILPMPTKRRWLTRGIYQIGKRTKLLLSQGSGYSGSRLRIGTDNEICDVTLIPSD